jgi:hypothetical protein
MPGFQVGDILSKLGIDISGLKSSFDEAKRAAKTFSSEVKKSIADISSGTQQAAGIEKITAAFTRAADAASKFADAQGKIKSALLTQVKAPKIEIGASAGAIGGLITGFKVVTDTLGKIGSVGVKAFGLVTSAISSTVTSVTGLIRSLISIPSLLAGFGAFKLAQRAADVDDLTTAFDNLSKEIGTLSGNFLPKLRQATRGTVSDLDLMREANSAIILGVAKDADAFAQLAENARRLGQAVGRGPTDALNDLVTGIGRQSFRLLDNIGIIVRTGEAYDAYAAKIGKTTKQLTAAEERLAFQLAVQEKIRKKVAELGPEVLTVGTAFRQLGATVSNTFSDISTAIVSADALTSITRIIESNRASIAAFVTFIRLKVDQIVSAVIDGFNRFKSGNLNLTELFDATIGEAFRVLSRFALSVITKLGPIFFQAGFVIGKALGEGVLTSIRAAALKSGTAVRTGFFRLTGIENDAEALQNRIKESFSAVDRTLREIGRRGIVSNAEQGALTDQFKQIVLTLDRVAGGIEKPSEEILDRVIDFRAKLENILERPASRQTSQELADISRQALAELGSEAEEIIGGVGNITDKTIAALTGDKKKTAEESARLVAIRRELQRDPIANFKPLNTDRVVRPLAIFVNKLAEVRRSLLLTFGQKIPDEAVRQSAALIQLFANGVEFAQKKIRQLREALAGPSIDAQRFDEFLRNVDEEIEKIDFEGATAGFTQTAKAIALMNREVEKLGEGDAVQKGKIADRLGKLFRVGNLSEARAGVAGLEDQLRQIGKTSGEQIREDIQRKIDEVQLRHALDPDNPAVRQELDALHAELQKAATVEAKIDVANAEQAIEGMFDQLGTRRLSPGEKVAADIIKAMERLKLKINLDPDNPELKRQIALLNDQLELALRIEGRLQFEDLTKDLSTSVFQGIVDGFERGESAAKIWSGIVSDIFRKSMAKVIDGLTNTISSALGDVFTKLGGSLGAANFATGLLGIGSAILVGLKNRRDQTVSDFAQSVNSSESVRGVVAGPTNIAIARVGDSLKVALQTTESLLLRIATDIENGRGGGTATGGFFSMRTTPSSTT